MNKAFLILQIVRAKPVGDALRGIRFITQREQRWARAGDAASLGAHPAFRWPLAGGQREAHRLVFAKPESAPISRVSDGLLDAHPYPNPVDGTVLKLRDDLFTQDALIFDQLQSHSVRYLAPGALGIEFSWDGFQQLGVWTKPGSDFLCIEPWAGMASPAGFDGEFASKPGVFSVEPGGRRFFRWSARVLPLNS